MNLKTSKSIRYQGNRVVLRLCQKKNQMIEGRYTFCKYLLLVKFCRNPYNSFRADVWNTSANQRLRRPYLWIDFQKYRDILKDDDSRMVSFKSRQWFQGKEKLIASINQRPGRPYACLNISTKQNTSMVEGASYSLHVKFCKNNSCFGEVELCDIVIYDDVWCAIAIAVLILVWA